jgi:uncharacterized protein (TIGR02265 family)
MAQVKGTAVLASVRFVRDRFGEPALTRVLDALTSEDRSLLSKNILVSAWFPMSLLLRFMVEAERQLAPEEPELARAMGRASADYGLTTVYRMFFRVASPEFIIGRATRVFGSYYDTGNVVPIESGPGHAIFTLEGFEGAAQFCARILGWMERTLELAGAKDIQIAHATCVYRGDDVCRFEGTWS